MIGLFLAFTIALLIFRNYLNKVKTHKILDKQKNEIENLLLNILPKEVAHELQMTGHATPRQYESVFCNVLPISRHLLLLQIICRRMNW
jgi:hypothetical protein